ncbi:type 4 prepilin-like proteins leader peptide-processing enzyme [Desulfuromonas versatilis]|uniref:Prepilin leader peptidase/N-methyltransferase n=1 Tax=Desulfuromonas versatilis TaxID=2802975 RepID=A0ABM8HVG4_9BACT|nr:A24 family peptidase [Desulfuromonas versatilis]BCR04677.1 type 4 prepilin-like proteins leader peptide-processing enzyme [Desulfuromonas versatilis]
MPPIYYLALGFAFTLGACIGSFLNVCIYRIPAGESIVSPPSRCPNCGAGIRWYQNIPILSYLLLGGKCASCKVRISPRYPLVEALTGLLFVLVLYYFGISWATPVYWLFVATLVVITFIDLDHQIIPDVISLPGIPIGFACSFAIPWISWSDSLLGILIGGGSLFLVAFVYELLTKKEGMGGGDIKLLAMLGAFLGWKAVLPIIFISSLLGSLVGVPVMLLKKADSKLAIPFGPFLAAGALIFLFWGRAIIHWYLSFFVT